MSDLARSFGAQAGSYDRSRPGWPVEAVDVVGLRREAVVLDLAAGTGKLTRVLAERFDRVLAAEADAAMRALNPDSLAGSAEAIPVADASVEGVFVAEASHWFDPPAAIAEIARVLRPGGVLALLWNVPPNDFVDYCASISWVAVLPEAERRPRIERFRSYLDRERYERPIRTEVYCAERL